MVKAGDSLDKVNYLKVFEKFSLDAIMVLSSDETYLNELKEATAKSSMYLDIKNGITKKHTILRDDLIYVNDLIFIPNQKLQLKVLNNQHDSATVGHYGTSKTVEFISRDFYWPKLRSTVKKYIKNCDICSRAKPMRHAPYGLLQPLPIPTACWIDISMDFITDLPTSKGFDAIVVVKDRLSKEYHFVPTTKSITAEGLSELYIQNIF